MQRYKFIRALCVIGSLLLCNFAFADGDPVTITVTGTIVASPCEVDPDSKNISIPLGDDIQAKNGVNAGAVMSRIIDSEIKLINCPAGTSTVTATFHGTPDPTDPSFLYKNSGTAKNVAVALQYHSGWGQGDGTSIQSDIDSNGEVTFPMQSYAYSLGGATPGTISSVVTVSFAYN